MKLTQFERPQMASDDDVKDSWDSSSYSECEDCNRIIQGWTAFKEHLYLKSHMLGHYRFRRIKTGNLESDPMWTGASEKQLYERCFRVPNRIKNVPQPAILTSTNRQRQSKGNMHVIGTTDQYLILSHTPFMSPSNQERTRFLIKMPKRRTSFLFWNQSEFMQKKGNFDANVELEESESSVRSQVEKFQRDRRLDSPSQHSGFKSSKRCHECNGASTEGAIDRSDGYWYCKKCWEKFHDS